MNESSEVPVNNKTKKRSLGFYLKVFLTFFLLMLLAAGIAVFYVYHRLTSDAGFEKILMARISSAIHMQVSFDKLDIAFPGFTINNAAVATDSPELKLDARISRISLTPDFWAAFNGQLVLDSLSLGSGTINVEIPVSKKAPAEPAKVASSPAFDPAGLVFPFNSLHAESIQLNIKDSASGKKHAITLKSATLDQSLLSSALPFSLEVASPQYAELSMSGNLYWPDSVQASINLKNANLKELVEFVPEAYRKQFSLIQKPELKVAANYKIVAKSLQITELALNAEPGLKFSASADFSSLSPVNGTLTGRVEPLDVALLMQVAKDFLPPEYEIKINGGKVGASLELGLQNSTLEKTKVTIKPSGISLSAKPLPEAVSLGSGEITWDGKKVMMSSLKAGFAGSNLELASAEAGISPVDFNGKLVAKIDFDQLWPKIKAFLPESAHRVTPSGAASFNGSLSYRQEKIALDGQLDSPVLKLLEASTKAQGQLEDIKVKFVKLGPANGAIEIASLRLKGAGGDVGVKGSLINSVDPGFDLKATGKLNLADFSSLAASIFKLPVRQNQFSGLINIDLYLGGTLSDLQPKGALSFVDVKADLSERGMVIAGLNGSAAANMKSLEIKNLSAQIMGGKLDLSGSLNDFKKPLVKAEAKISGADLGKIRGFIGLNFPEMPKELEVSGVADLVVNVSGPIAEPKIDGTSTLKAVRFFHPAVLRPVESISGPIAFNNSGLTTSRLEARWGTSAATVKGELKDWGKLVSNFNFEVNPLDATDAAGFFLKETGYKLTGSGTGSGKITGELEKIKVAGKAELPQGLFTAPVSEGSKEVFRFPFSNLTAQFSYFNRVFSVESAETAIFAGKVTASGQVDINTEPIGFNFSTRLNQIETSAFLQENSSMKNVLRGGVDGSADIKGNVTGLNSINGVASLLMKKGAYTSPPVVQKICEQLNAMHLASGTIENLSGDYSIANGRISSKNTMAKSKDGKMIYTGSVGLDTSLDGTLTLEINRAACQQSPVLKQLVGNSETLSVPVSLKGSLTSPSVGIPLDKMLKDAASKQIKQSVEKKATDALGKIFGIKKKEPAPAQVATTTAQPAQTQQNGESKPAKKIENKIKDIGKDLKKIFKF